MGFLDSILGKSEPPKETEQPKTGGTAFKVSINFAPVRLSAMKESMVRMLIKITNISDSEQMVSADILLSKSALIGFEKACITKHQEKQIGKVAAGETTEISVPIYSTNQTKDGTYPFKVVVYAHYLDYNKVISKVEKKGEIRVA